MSNSFEPYDFTKIRLFVEPGLRQGALIPLSEGHAHYLRNVMRKTIGEAVLVFNGRDGEWRAAISELSKKGGALIVDVRSRQQDNVPDIELLFAPVKRAPLDFLVQKATELGVASLRPVITERTNVTRINVDRLRANAIEAAEQSGRMTVPEVHESERLPALLHAWPDRRRLVFCDESRQAVPMARALEESNGANAWAILVGPEGGFSDTERQAINGLKVALPVSLGPRIMRADTAALAAMTIWQSVCGDLQGQ